MREWAEIDSRQYILAFELRTLEDCPADFPLPPSLDGFDAGLFLPRDEPDWFGRSSYPPRILLLKQRALHVISHPGAAEPAVPFPLERIAAVESAHMLLKGLLRITGPGLDYTIRYNTRGLPSVAGFLRCFRGQLLGNVADGAVLPLHWGPGLDMKFANALAAELDPGETALVQYSHPPGEVKWRSWLLPRRRSIPGELLALTSRRLLWITDRDRASYMRYGSIARYAPLEAVESVGLAPGGREVQVILRSTIAWSIPLALEASEDCRRLAEALAATFETLKKRNESNRAQPR